MKNYTITVNGNVYDVVVEEGASAGASVAAPRAAAAPCRTQGRSTQGGRRCRQCED